MCLQNISSSTFFYVNEMNTSKPKKKKRKAAEECDAESDNEEIDNPLDSADLSLEAGTSIIVMIWNKL